MSRTTSLLSVLTLTVCAFQEADAASFTVDNINYNILSSTDRTLSVTYFSQGGRTSLSIPSTVAYNNETYRVIEIGDHAFMSSTLEDITLPNTIENIGKLAFYECKYLANIEMSESLISIGEYAFAYCSLLENVNLPSTLEYLGPYAFRDCTSLEEIIIPDNLGTISSDTFRNCTGLRNIKWGASLTNIENNAFTGCKSLTSIELPASVTTLGTGVFYECTSLKDVKLNNSLTVLPKNTFSLCGELTNVDLGNSIEVIGEMAFLSCPLIKEITLPSSLKSIQSQAFYSGLEKVKCEALNVPQLEEKAFFKSAVQPLPVLYVFEEVINNYRSSSWNQYFRLITTINDNIYPTEIIITPSVPEVLAVGETIPVQAIVLPDNATEQIVKWQVYRGFDYVSMEVSPQDPNTIFVTGIKPGQAGISAVIFGEFAWISKYLQITVTENGEPFVAVTSVVITPSEVKEMEVGESITFTATVYPADATYGTVTWELSEGSQSATFTVSEDNPNIATLTANKVDNLIFGAVIKEQFQEEGEYVFIPVVNNPQGNIIPVEGIEIEGNFEKELNIGEKLQLQAIFYPENATNKEVTWSSSNTGVASVSDTGLVEALSNGETEITVRSKGNQDINSSVTIKVNSSITDNIFPTEIIITPSVPEVLAVGETIPVQATVLPDNATEQIVKWQVYRGFEYVSMEVSYIDPNIIYVTGIQPGQAGISAVIQGESGWISEDLQITVTENGEPFVAATSVVITPSEVKEMEVGQSITFMATVYPADATYSTVTWELSEGSQSATFTVSEDNPNIATLTANKVDDLIFGAFIKEQIQWVGEYVLIPVVNNPEEIIIPVEAIEIEGNFEKELKVGEKLQLQAIIYPENATYKDVTWSSSNIAVASVSNTGLVEALSPGETEITVRNIVNQEVSNTVTLSIKGITSGIESLSPDSNGKYNVYSPSGIIILSTDNVNELKNLLPGLYLINGKKMILK